jgi:hypothetical protein
MLPERHNYLNLIRRFPRLCFPAGGENEPSIIARRKRRRKLRQWSPHLFHKHRTNRRRRLLFSLGEVAKFQIATKSPACIAPLDCRRFPSAGGRRRICNAEVFIEKVAEPTPHGRRPVLTPGRDSARAAALFSSRSIPTLNCHYM